MEVPCVTLLTSFLVIALHPRAAAAACSSTATRRSAASTPTACTSAATRRARAACACRRGSGPRAASSARRQTQSDYLNACSTAECVPFDNCARLGLCDADGGAARRRSTRRTQHPAAGQPGDGADAELQRRVAEPHLHVRHVGLRADVEGGAAAAVGGQSAVSRHLPERELVRRRHLGVRLDQAHSSPTRRRPRRRTTPSTSTTTGQQHSCLLDAAGNTVDIGVSNLFCADLQHLDGDLTSGHDA